MQLIFLMGGGPVREGGPFFVPSANLTVDALLRALFVPGFLKPPLTFSGFLGSSLRINSSKDSKENPVSDLLNSVNKHRIVDNLCELELKCGQGYRGWESLRVVD